MGSNSGFKGLIILFLLHMIGSTWQQILTVSSFITPSFLLYSINVKVRCCRLRCLYDGNGERAVLTYLLKTIVIQWRCFPCI